MVSIPDVEERLYVAHGVGFSVKTGLRESESGHDGDGRPTKATYPMVWATVAFVRTTLIVWR